MTGGYGHLGRAMCSALAQAGALVFVGGRDRGKFDRAFDNTSDNIEFVPLDLAREESISQAISTVGSDGLDILVNNGFYLAPPPSVPSSKASPLDYSGLNTGESEQWRNGLTGTLGSVFHCCQHALPYLRTSSQARIINIASMYGMVAPSPWLYHDCPEHTNQVSYGVAKAGVLQLTRYLASFLASDGICVNAISPGPFLTEDTKAQHGFHRRIRASVPLGRSGEPDELRGAILLLASKASSYITGQNIVVDGGWTVR